jgi:protein-L-isoaspartate(D-aspartate) O-methyltransferase
MDFDAARRAMVDSQVRTSDVTDRRIIAAMLELPRQRFVPDAEQALAYIDQDVPVARGSRGEPLRRLLKPMVLAKLVQAAGVRETDHVLDVGCATGYSSALLARLGGSVVALEEEPALARFAREALASMGETRVELVTGPLTAGWPGSAPYDLIFLNGASEVVPRVFAPQLKEGGRLAAIVGKAPAGKAMLYRWIDGDFSGWPIFDAGAPLLPGLSAPPVFVF